MVLGIAFIIVGALGAIGVAGFLTIAAFGGTAELGSLVLTSRGAAALAVLVAAAGIALVFVGIGTVMRVHLRRGFETKLDARAREAEEEARATLLQMRLQQLRHEVEQLELVRAGVGEDGATKPKPARSRRRPKKAEDLVVLPDAT